MAITAILTIEVKYRNATAADKPAITAQLEYCARHLASEGLLSGSLDFIVDGWSTEDVTFPFLELESEDE